jgi:putative transposase
MGLYLRDCPRCVKTSTLIPWEVDDYQLPGAADEARAGSVILSVRTWRTSDRCNTDLVLGALEYGIWSRDTRAGELIHHSDRGSTYTTLRFSERLSDNGITASMGSVGDSYDALMEDFWSTLKIELVYRTTWRTRDEADNAIFAYVDGWYNRERIQKDLGWLSPDEYEAAWYTTAIDPSTPATINPELAPAS